MKKITFLILILIIGGLTTQAQHQELAPDGVPYSEINNDQNSNDSRAVIDYIFASSDTDPLNVLILNGISIPTYGSGWYFDDGYHGYGNENYICGYTTNYGGGYYRNFFAFDLSTLAHWGITLPITTATLHVRQYSSNPASGTKMWHLSNVSTPYSLIDQGYPDPSPAGIVIYTDLGEGTPYGSIEVDRTLPWSNVVQVVLNSGALADINAAAQSNSMFVIGGQADSEPEPLPVPISNWAIIIGLLLIGTFIVIRFKRIG